METLIQTIGTRGTFSVKEPYNTLIQADAVYIVVDMSLLTNLLRYNGNLKDTIYFQLNVPEEVYDEDLVNNVTIVVLEDESGRHFYIPDYAFNSIAKNDGKYYQHTVLTVEMGAHVVDVDLTVLKEAIKDNVHNLYGVRPRVKDFKTSDKRMIPYTQHNEIINRRKLVKQDASNYKLLLEEALEREAVYKTTITELENYIIANCP